MKKFKNKKTGNIVIPQNKQAIELMEKSDNYVAVKDAGKQEK